MTLRFASGIRGLSESYAGVILDLWGVVHDGFKPYPGAVHALTQLKAAGKLTLLLSNAPRRKAVLAEKLEKMGIPPTLYGAVHSSGEEAWQALRTRTDPWHAKLGRACLHLGPARDRNMLEGLDLREVKTPETADFILNTGTDRDAETLADYENILARGAKAGVPMVCANPDREVLRGKKRILCAGALAARYEALGGDVRYHGKPDPAVFAHAMRMLDLADRRAVLVIGDSLATDIQGATRAGLDSVLVTGGLHADELGLTGLRETLPDPGRVAALLEREGFHPIAVIPSLVW